MARKTYRTNPKRKLREDIIAYEAQQNGLVYSRIVRSNQNTAIWVGSRDLRDYTDEDAQEIARRVNELYAIVAIDENRLLELGCKSSIGKTSLGTIIYAPFGLAQGRNPNRRRR